MKCVRYVCNVLVDMFLISDGKMENETQRTQKNIPKDERIKKKNLCKSLSCELRRFAFIALNSLCSLIELKTLVCAFFGNYTNVYAHISSIVEAGNRVARAMAYVRMRVIFHVQ